MTTERWGTKWSAELDQLIAELPEHPADMQRALRRRAARDPIAFAILYFGDQLKDPETGEISFANTHSWSTTSPS